MFVVSFAHKSSLVATPGHSRTVLSSLPETMRRPSGLNATLFTAAVCGEQTHHALTAGGGVVERFAPPLADMDAGARVEVEEDLVGQTWILFAEPLLERLGLAIIRAGVAEE